MKSLLIVALLLVSTATPGAEFFASRNILLNNQLYHLEVAKTPGQHRQGLMHRKSIARDGGMLFVYQRPGQYRIWMKNTLIPLTVIWLDEQATISGIKTLQPCHQLRCPSYGVNEASKYILELHAERRQDFVPGQRLVNLLALD